MLNSSKRKKTTDQEVYLDLDGQAWNLRLLDKEERALVENLRRRAARSADWNEFDNYWMKEITALYEPRGLSRREIAEKPVFQIAQDLSGRIAVDKGYARLGDYRDDLEVLIRTSFKNRRAFCKATGLSEDMLSHVFAGRKDLSIQTLSKALAKIGCRLNIVPTVRAG